MSSVTPNLPYQALYRTCMKEAAAQGRMLMQRLVRRAAQTMPLRAARIGDAAERKLLTDAARTLLKHEGALCEAYPQALLGEFAQAISGDTRKAGALSFDSLELMGDEQMQESVDLLRLQQVVMAEVEADLTELNALVCAVQGLRSVQADRNPLRPEVYVRSLRTVALQSPVPTAVRARWMQHLGEAMAPELARVYQELCMLMRAQGVVGAGFTAVPAAETPRPATLRCRARLAGQQPAEREGTPAAAVRRNAGARPGAAGRRQHAAAGFFAHRARGVRGPAGDEAGRPGDAAHAAARPGARGFARGARRRWGRKWCTSWSRTSPATPGCCAPVQQTVRDLEPALLRLALDDPRFFSDRQHPARRCWSR